MKFDDPFKTEYTVQGDGALNPSAVSRTRRITSNVVTQYMTLFEDVQRDEDRSAVAAGTVHIEPTLIWDYGKVSLEITVGRERQYVVKSLKDFCRAMMDGSELTFGRGLQFRACPEAFDGESRPLAQFLMQQYSQLYDLKKLQDGYKLDEIASQLFLNNGRAMVLTPQATDRLMELLDRRSFHFEKKQRYLYNRGGNSTRPTRSRLEEGFNARVRLVEGEPVVAVELEDVGDGVVLRGEKMPVRFAGEKCLYLIDGGDGDDGILWKAGGAYAKRMGAFFEMMSQAGGGVFVAERDLTRFCVNIYGVVRQWLDIRGDETLLSRHMPWDLEGLLYLDSPAGGVITARLYGDYGPVTVNLYSQTHYMGEGVLSDAMAVTAARAQATGLMRNEVQEIRMCNLVEPYFTDIDLDAGMLVIRDDNDLLYEFLKRGQAELAPRMRMFVTDRYKRLMFPAKSKMAAGVSIAGDLLRVTFDLEGFPPDELGEMLSAYRVKRKYYRLKSGAFVSMEDGEIRDAMELAAGLQLTREEMNAGQATLPRYRALYVDEVAKKSGELTVRRDDSFSSLIRAIRDVDEAKLAIPASLDGVLRDYQKTGFRWLKTMADLGFGGILADDMGLGKTLQVIALLTEAAMRLRGEAGAGADPAASDQVWTGPSPFDTDVLALVVCPASLVWNWAKELQKFAPGLKAVAVAGSAAVRKRQIQTLSDMEPEERRRTVVITSYDLLKRDLELYQALYFHYHIVDEAQYIKNFTTKNAKAVMALESGHRFALTGTPIENRLSDLWSIFNFLMPGYLGSYVQFRQQYEHPILEDNDEAAATLLQNQVRPFILRRLKQKVLKELPEKVESVMYVPLEGEQQKLYMANLAKIKLEVGRTISEGGFETNKLQVLALLTRLRQLCCHPALCYENYAGGSAKLEACMELVREAVNGGHRILLFSQFTGMLDLIEERLRKEEIGYYVLTGQTPKSVRQTLVTQFNEGRVPVFLISLKAGGTGLNLTGADIVIHYDPWWNLAAQNQATDRAYRMGQRSSVQVYKLVADGTIEEKILHLQEDKGTLAESVISENSAVLGGLNESELKELFG